MSQFFYNDKIFNEVTNKNIKEWLDCDRSERNKEEILEKISSDPSFIRDIFSKKLYFGTGGLRALMRLGFNAINVYTIRMASQGLVNYLLKNCASEKRKSIVIGYDNRHRSGEFAEEVAKIFIKAGFIVDLYDVVCPIALVSFGVLYSNAQAGVMITASHNPADYNGYKVYSDYGGQVVSPQDTGIAFEISQVKMSTIVDIDSKLNRKIRFVGKEIFDSYISIINTYQLYPEDNKNYGSSLHICYTNLHGTGITLVPRVLREWGFSSISLVKEQEILDGDFSTVSSPNPEDPLSLSLGVRELKRKKGDLLFATDPDCDRIGVAVLYRDKPFYFNGNQIACLLAEYICSTLQVRFELKKTYCIVKTLVTTELLKKIVETYHIRSMDVLTGFKYIGEKIALWKSSLEYEFLFGAEESQGYLYKDHVRDKDAVLTAALIAEMALHFKLKGLSLLDGLFDVYRKYGFYHAKTLHVNFSEGNASVISDFMGRIRKKLSSSCRMLGGKTIVKIEDYLTQHVISFTETPSVIDLPQSDIVRILFEDGSKVVFRPSGTELKLKLYFEIVENNNLENDIETAITTMDIALEAFISRIKNDLEISEIA